MGKSSSSGGGCLRIITFGKKTKQIRPKNNDHVHGRTTEFLQKNVSKRRWSFRKRASRHRVLRTTVANEPLSPSTERNGKEFICDQDKQATLASTEKHALSTLMEKTSENAETMLTLSTTEMNGSDVANSNHDADRNMQESSAIRIQAAIRAYLARRELSCLTGIVRLQAHVRGHLVRKQVARTLHFVQAIIKLQAIVRARRFRSSEQGLAIQEKLEHIRQQKGLKGSKLVKGRNGSNVSMNSNTVLTGKLLSNRFASQLLETVPKTDSLCIDYDQDDSNSASPLESGLLVQPKNATEHQDKSEKAWSLEAEVARKELNSNLVPVFYRSEVELETDKQNFCLTEELNSTSSSTSDYLQFGCGRNIHSLKEVPKSISDSIADLLSKQLKQVPGLGFRKDNVQKDEPNFGLRETSTTLLVSHSDKHETKSEQCDDSLRTVLHSKSDSISDKSSIQLKNLSDSSLEPILDQCGVRSDHSEVILRQKPHSTVGSCSDQTEVEGENNTCSSTKTPDSTFDSASGHPNIELKENSNEITDSSDEVKNEGETSKCSSSKVSNSTTGLFLNQQILELENSQSSFRALSNPTLNFELDSCEVKIDSPNSTLEVASNVKFLYEPVQLEAEAEKCAYSLRKISTSKLDTVLDQPNVVKKFLNGTCKATSEKPKDEPGESVSSSTKVPNLTLNSVSDDTSRQPEKVSNSLVHSVPNQPRNAPDTTSSSTSYQLHSPDEAENAKHNMDVLSNSIVDSVSDQVENKTENPMSSSVKVPGTVSSSDPKTSVSVELHRTLETVPIVQETSPIHLSAGNSPENLDNASPQQSIVSYGTIILSKPDKFESPKQNISENTVFDQKATRKRNSFGSGKADHPASDSQGSPSVPNYMAATVSAKAKARPHNSPKSSPDVQEKATNTKRRNSLPGSHGKQHLVSPRSPRISRSQVQRTTNGNSVLSPRYSAEKQRQE